MIPLPECYVISGGKDFWNADQMHAHAAAARRQALEEAAGMCERIADEFQRTEGHRFPELKSDAQTGASDCEDAIRALIDKDTAP